jgi:hypothetical protein
MRWPPPRAALLPLLGLGLGAPAAAAPPPAGASFWVLAEPTATVDARKAQALEATVATILAPLRPLARSRMAGKPDTCGRYGLEISDQQVIVRCDAETLTVPLNGGSVPVTADDGTPLQARATRGADALVLRFEGEQATQETRIRVEGGQLLVRKEIQSSFFAVPLRCDFLYAPAAGAAGK